MAKVTKALNASQDDRVTAKLISQIKQMIANGTIAPGTKFPPERELAKDFGVNRASVRQVLKVLEMMGVLTQKVGDGTYLSNSAETRLIVEPELTARAAERATTEDLNALRNSISAMQNSKTTQDRLNADMAFHDAIFRASGNRICHLLFKQIHRTVLLSMSHLSNRVSLEQPLMYHRKIYAAIRARDSEAARRTMREHILDARSLLSHPAARAEATASKGS